MRLLTNSILEVDLCIIHLCNKMHQEKYHFSDLKFARLRNFTIGNIDVILDDGPRTSNSPFQNYNMTFDDGSVSLYDESLRPSYWPMQVLNDRDFEAEYTKWRANPLTYVPPDPPTTP